jgi:hypothetical protein
MLCVRLGWRGTQAAALSPHWRAASSLPPSATRGLLARQWQLDRGTLRGCYLFEEDEVAAAGFVSDPTIDPAFALLAGRVGAAAREPPQVASVAAAANVDRPVFVVAAPRSGSTMLFDLLAQAPGLWTQGGEGQGAVEGIATLHPAARGYASDRLTDDDVTPRVRACLYAGWRFGLRDRHGRRFDDAVADEAAHPPRLLDKTTEHSLRVAFLARACPDARFVLLHRDARQNVSSLMQAWRHGGFVRLHGLPDWPGHDWCFLLPPGWRELRGAPLQAIATAQWEAANHWALLDLETLDQARWTTVDYNELVAHPHLVMTRLCSFLDLEIDAHLAAYLKRPLPVSPTAISPPSAIKWRSNRELDVPLLEAATRVTSARLRSMRRIRSGLPPPAAAATAVSAVRFACHLAEVATDGDASALEAGNAPSADSFDDLLVDRAMRFQLGASIPVGLATVTRFRERFLADRPIVWTRDVLTQAYRPFWVPRHQAELFAGFEPGAPAPHCPAPLRERLRAAGIVATSAERDAAERHAAKTRTRLAREFADRGYCVVPRVFAAAHTAALARYYRDLVASGNWAPGDDQVARRHGWHNESVARFFHHQLTGFVGAIVGAPVCASYSYVSAYQHGAELDPHVDRKQCEYTLSLIIDETGGRSSDWPLWFLAGEGRSAVTLDVGEGVLFRGHDLPHWRETAPHPALALSTLLMHYVPADFAETLY